MSVGLGRLRAESCRFGFFHSLLPFREQDVRDRYGDAGRDVVLHLGRTLGGLSIRELSRLAQIEDVSAATALRRVSARARKDREVGEEDGFVVVIVVDLNFEPGPPVLDLPIR
jgi:hypothetical protein